MIFRTGRPNYMEDTRQCEISKLWNKVCRGVATWHELCEAAENACDSCPAKRVCESRAMIGKETAL